MKLTFWDKKFKFRTGAYTSTLGILTDWPTHSLIWPHNALKLGKGFLQIFKIQFVIVFEYLSAALSNGSIMQKEIQGQKVRSFFSDSGLV